MVPTLLVTLLLAVAAGTAPDRVDVTMLTGTLCSSLEPDRPSLPLDLQG